MRRRQKTMNARWMYGLVAVAAFATTGCENPLIGEWEAKDGLSTCVGAEGEFDIDDELQGEGKLTASDGTSCFICNFDVEVTDLPEFKYDFTFRFTDCTFGTAGQSKFDFDCELDDDDLRCDAPEITPYEDWERRK